MALLDQIRSPEDLRALPAGELPALAEEIRERIIAVTAKNGGHIGPNLGVVELTLALHRVFETPKDRFVFDVSHQAYVHKLLTGRQGEAFENIRRTGGLSGFMSREESAHDCYGAGHAGTALSAALGMAVARDRKGTDEHVVCVIGDASLTCGITMEALNNLAASARRLIVILNDNEWSIDRNVGAISGYLNQLLTNPVYNRVDSDLKAFFKRMPGGGPILRFGEKWKRETKDFFVSSGLFESFNIRYLGPIDGHDLEGLTHFLEFAKTSEAPLLLHVRTEKGRGYKAALNSPEKFHGSGPFDPETGESLHTPPGTPPSYQDVFGRKLVQLAREDETIVGITGAMPSGTGLKYLRDELPQQYFDVGIAEEHAVLFAAGLAASGMKPVVAIYSTFLQRAYDPIVHDVCLQKLPVTFCMDRAGLSPGDGPTHHGLFDIAYLRCVPEAFLAQPKDEDELADLLWTALQGGRPFFLRYPRGAGTGVELRHQARALPVGEAEVLREGEDIALWALGPWVQDALRLADRLQAEANLSVAVVNARFVKPLDRERLAAHARGCSLLVTLEDHVVSGGFGSAVTEALAAMKLPTPVECIGWPDRFVGHASSVEELRADNGLDDDTIIGRILAACPGEKNASEAVLRHDRSA